MNKLLYIISLLLSSSFPIADLLMFNRGILVSCNIKISIEWSNTVLYFLWKSVPSRRLYGKSSTTYTLCFTRGASPNSITVSAVPNKGMVLPVAPFSLTFSIG